MSRDEDDQVNYRAEPGDVRSHLADARAALRSTRRPDIRLDDVREPETLSDAPAAPDDPAKRKAFALLRELGIKDRTERLELASMLLRMDVESWNQLDRPQVFRLLDALYGAHLVDTIKRDRISRRMSADV